MANEDPLIVEALAMLRIEDADTARDAEAAAPHDRTTRLPGASRMTASTGEAAEVPFMLNPAGECFEGLAGLETLLAALDDPGRTSYRNNNAAAIATCGAERLLIVAGPGSGKSHLFLARIRHWLPQHPAQQVYVSTFVRKLVEDLRGEIQKLPENDQKRVHVSTLHTLARSVAERNRGTRAQPMRRNIRVIDGFWARITWDDVLAFHPDLPPVDVKELEAQYHTGEMDPSPGPVTLEGTYRALCRFYNAVGFAYMIRLATEAVSEQPALVEHQLWIIDEYQDFNASEDLLIRIVTEGARGVLMAGDDDQALYQTLKASTPDIIVGHYRDQRLAKAMLPFCGRCGFHICRAASAFIAKHRAETSVEKIYLPITVEPDASRVRVIGTASATGAVDYIRWFLEDADTAFQAYLGDRSAGRDTDPFLLILTPTGAMTFARNSPADNQLVDLVNEYADVEASRSEDYLRVATYHGAGNNQDDNLAVRKVLHFENVSFDEVNQMIREAMERDCRLSEIVLEQLPEIIDRIMRVAQIVTTGINDPHGSAADLAHVLDLQDPVVLGQELEADPIGRNITDKEDEEALETETAGALPPVALMSMTRSKGLSAHHVIILGSDDVHMNNTSALTFFVALTRARSTLQLITSLKTEGATSPHPFVYDLPADCCEYLTFKKTPQRTLTTLQSKQALKDKFAFWVRGQRRGR